MSTAEHTRDDTADLLISADSHVMESPQLWLQGLAEAERDPISALMPDDLAKGFQGHPGGYDPNARLHEMAQDGVSAEVLYPTLGLRLFAIDRPALQEECFRLYNDWLIDYCCVAPDQLVGVALIPAYDVDHAITELTRCRTAGLRGAEVWQSPPEALPFHSRHYERLWSAAEELGVPMSLHILTGHDYSRRLFAPADQYEMFRGAVNLKLASVSNAVFDLIFSGVFERHPRLRVVLVENEIGWIPFILQQWDYYYLRFRQNYELPIDKVPSEYFMQHIYATFFNDAVGTRQLQWWGVNNCMWSNDFPHPNSTWPRSREVIARHLGYLSAPDRRKLVSENVVRLYGIRDGAEG